MPAERWDGGTEGYPIFFRTTKMVAEVTIASPLDHRRMNTPSHPRRRPPQMSLGFMMMTTLLIAFMLAEGFYALRVPAVQEEIDLLWYGKPGGSSAGGGRLAYITFIMFTFTSPLLLAGALSTGIAVMRRIKRQA